MSKAAQLEHAIANAVKRGDSLPQTIPDWLQSLGIIPGDLIISSTRIGTKSTNNKTDILIKFEKSPSLKISAKLSNADYFGNWYGHKRFIDEFGSNAFEKMTVRVTEWANQWAYHPNANLFVGVSISFGSRVGNTFIPFLNIFESTDEIIKIVAGFGDGDGVANCLYISDTYPSHITDIVENLSPIDSQAIARQSESIKIICRPVNPLTEVSNRGKNVYTRFKPFAPLTNLTTITNLASLMQFGNFVEVEHNKINHNHILKDLEHNYNILIPRKQK